MANDQSRRMTPAMLKADLDAFAALRAIANYSPANPNFEVTVIETARQNMEHAQTAETQASAAYDTARDETVARQWEFHNAILGVKTQVAAQFGPNSNEIQALGMKKKSEYARPARRKSGKTGSDE